MLLHPALRGMEAPRRTRWTSERRDSEIYLDSLLGLRVGRLPKRYSLPCPSTSVPNLIGMSIFGGHNEPQNRPTSHMPTLLTHCGIVKNCEEHLTTSLKSIVIVYYLRSPISSTFYFIYVLRSSCHRKCAFGAMKISRRCAETI